MRGSEIAAIYGSIKGLRYQPSSAADRVPFRRLSAPFAAATVDLQARVDSAAAAAELPPAMWEFDETLSICTSAGGTWNAVVIWFEVRAEEAGSAGVFTGGEEKLVGAGAATKPPQQRDTLVLRIQPAQNGCDHGQGMQTTLACRRTCAQACA